MSRFEKRLSIVAILFVVVYIGAVAVSIRSRFKEADRPTQIESARATPDESHLMLAELFLPMLILLTIAVCFIIVKKKRDKARLLLEDSRPEGHRDR